MKLQSGFDGNMAWVKVTKYIQDKKLFKSITGIEYEARLSSTFIFYKGGDRNNGEEESISKDDFISAFDAVKSLPYINTSNIKGLIPTSIYRKRTPFIGLLLSSSLLSN